MKKLFLCLILWALMASNAYSFWIWTPETNKWVNPKYSVKETPQDQLQYALDFYEAKDYKKALLELKKLIKHYPRAREAADAQYYLGVLLEEQGDLMDAFRSFQKTIEKYPFSERSAQIIQRQFDIGNQILEGRDKRNKVIKTIVGADYDVVEIFRTVIKNAPYGELAAPSQYKIGLYLLEKGLYQEARDEFEKTANDYPNSEWAEAARYQIALSDAMRSPDAEYDQKVTQVAIKELEIFTEEHPEAQLSESALTQIQKLREKEAENNYLVAEFYQKRKKYEAAKIYYTTIVDNYKDTAWASQALEKLRMLNTQINTGKQ